MRKTTTRTRLEHLPESGRTLDDGELNGVFGGFRLHIPGTEVPELKPYPGDDTMTFTAPQADGELYELDDN